VTSTSTRWPPRSSRSPGGRADELGLEVAELGLELAVVAPDVLRHAIPLGELLARAGLGIHGDYVLLPDEDPDEWVLDRQRSFIDPDGDYDLMTVDAVARLATLRTSLRKGSVDLDAAAARGLDAGLTDPDATDLAATYLLGILGDTDGSIARTLDTIEAALPHPPGAGLYVLRARIAEFDGDTAAQLAAIDAALSRDPDFPPALEDHAWNLEDRGDATAALAALRRADVRPDDAQYARLQEMTRPLFPRAGRNDPCPCGSGVKYKRCHLNRTDRDLAERVDWLLAKAMTFAHRPAHRLKVLEFIDVFGTSIPDGQVAALDDPIVAGMLLFDLGLMRDFVDVRGALLPEDERSTSHNAGPRRPGSTCSRRHRCRTAGWRPPRSWTDACTS
jgi:tetratricopeptide (TPR) repeat protein